MAKRSFWVPVLFLLGLFVSFRTEAASSESGVSPHRKLVVAVMAGPPWSMQDDDGRWTGITVELWREVAAHLNLEYEFKQYDLEGISKAVQDGAVDLAAAGMAITSEREAKFDFSDPYFVFNQTVAVNANQQPTLLQVFRSVIFNWNFFGVMIPIVGITFVGGLLLYLFERKGDSEHYSRKDKAAFFRALFWSTIVLAGRDLPESTGWRISPPKTLAGRVFGIFWMLVGILLFSLFTAGAASLLTSRQLQSIVSSPDDLRHVRVGTVEGAAGQTYMDHRKIHYTSYETPLKLVTALADQRIDAAVYGSTTLAYYAKSMPNKIIVLRFALRQDFAAIPVRPGSPLRKPINRALLQVLESEKWHKIIARYVGYE